MTRRFTVAQRAALYLAADGRCANCRAELQCGWHADHIAPYSRGGPTDVTNGQALCPPCNRRKGNTPTMNDELRQWQREALRVLVSTTRRDLLFSATPGAGKTRLALAMARRMLNEHTVQRVVVVVPTDELRRQWAQEAAQVGIDLMPAQAPEDYDKSGYHGCVVTYAQLARGSGADLLRRATATPTVAFLDEIHHAGDSRSWGDGVRHALEHAVRRIGLTGTPWRQDRTSPIPFVTYDHRGNVQVDHAYEYGEAVAAGVCRRIEFHAYDGEARWVDCGRIVSAEMGERLDDADVPAVLDTVLDPGRPWIQGLLRAAAADLDEIRREIPDAGGLVIAETQQHARSYVTLLEQITGRAPTLAVSDDTEAADNIAAFRQGRTPWLVAVRMVSEGVDIRRLAVGVYAAKARTPLFFRQVVGRFVRARPGEEINAKLLIPAIPTLMAHAHEIEEELRHSVDLSVERHAKDMQAADNAQRVLPLREPLSASDATFATSIYGGNVATAEEVAQAEQYCRDRNVPTMWAPNFLNDIRAARAKVEVSLVVKPAPVQSRAQTETMLRGDIKTLVGKVARRSGFEPQEVNAELLRRGHPPRAKCSVEQLEAVRDELADWLGAL